MTDETKALSESQSAEAANAAAVAEEARQKASAAQMKEVFLAGMEEFFTGRMDDHRFIDVGRIPFICDDLRGIHAVMVKMQATQDLVAKIVFGFVAIILLGVAGVAGTVMLTVLSAKG